MPATHRQSSTGPRSGGRLADLAILVGWAGAVAWLTLTPAGASGVAPHPSCLFCQERATADFLLNVVLFVPGGWALRRVLPTRGAMAAVVAVTAAIELAQGLIPGRDPALEDLLANVLGGLAGALLTRPVVRRRVRPWIPVAVAAVWLAPFALLRPVATGAVLYGQWTPELGGYAVYGGRIRQVRVGPMDVPSAAVRDSRRLRRLLQRRAPVVVTLVAGPPSPGTAPIFSIFDESRRFHFMLAARGEDLVVRIRNAALAARLDTPDLVWRSALRGVEAGRELSISFTRSGGVACLTVATRRRCGIEPSAASGWAFLLNRPGAPRRPPGLDYAWAVLLAGAVLLGGAGSRGRAATLMAAGLAAGGGLASPDVGVDWGPTLLFALLLLPTPRRRRNRAPS